MRRTPFFIAVAFTLVFFTGMFGAALANTEPNTKVANWSGEWDARWRDGGARVTLTQNGDRVSGTYSLYDGRIEAVAIGRELKGQWIQENSSGSFVAVLSPDGKSFSARLGTGEWWTGIRAVNDRQAMGRFVDQSSPAMTMYHFLTTMNAVGPGTMELQSEASHLIDWSIIPNLKISRLDYTRLLFEVIDHTTFRIWDLQKQTQGDWYRAILKQTGTDFTFPLEFIKRDEQWLIMPIDVSSLTRYLREFKDTRVTKQTQHVIGVQSPRETIKTLMTKFDESDPSSIQRVMQTLNLSELSGLAKQYEAPRLASYLKEALRRVGAQMWQEIPNDPKALEPYVHFQHPVGQITIAPVETDQGTVWQFTPDTLKKIRALYAAIVDMPLTDQALAEGSARTVYFRVRDFAAKGHPLLVKRMGPMEAWQWLGLTLSLTLAYTLGRLVSIWAGSFLLRRFEKKLTEHPLYQWNLLWALRLFFIGITLRAVDEPLGLPDIVEVFILTLSWTSIIVAIMLLTLVLVNLVAERVVEHRSLAGHNITLVSLMAGILRVLVVVAALFLLADVLKLPYQGVIAGLGIGGLAVALAAQSTLQNFISGITLYFDKPIAIGDYCRFGSREGTVEFIGMRSTRIRTLDRTLVTIPNSEFSNMQIENYAKRDRMFLNTTLQLRYETTPDQLRFVLAEIRKLLISHPKVASDPLRVRFAGFGNHSLDIDIFGYVLTSNKAEFLAVREDIFLRIMSLVHNAGTQFAFPSMVYYQAKDTPQNPEKTQAAEAAVAQWRAEGNLPFPDLSWQEKAELSQSIEYPPEGSAVADEYKLKFGQTPR
jgi:MscS family membrane protein